MEWGDFHMGGSASLLFLECSVWPTCKTKASHSSSFSQAAPGQASDKEGKSTPTFLQHFQRPLWRNQLWFLWSKVHNIEKRLFIGLCGISLQGLEKKGEVAWTSQMMGCSDSD